jgi:four helix bundle protein
VLPRVVRFIHKMQIVLKEVRESRYWLRLIERVGLIPESVLPGLLRESDKRVKIFAKSVITAKGRVR